MHVPLLLYGMIIIYSFILRFAVRPYSQTTNLLIVIGSPLAAALIFCVGRVLIDKNPTARRTVRITYGVHLSADLLVVFALVKAYLMAKDSPGWVIPLPVQIGQTLTMVTGTLFLLSILNLAWDSMGAPASFLGITKKVAMRKMYAWTRNPMILCGLGT